MVHIYGHVLIAKLLLKQDGYTLISFQIPKHVFYNKINGLENTRTPKKFLPIQYARRQ